MANIYTIVFMNIIKQMELKQTFLSSAVYCGAHFIFNI